MTAKRAILKKRKFENINLANRRPQPNRICGQIAFTPQKIPYFTKVKVQVYSPISSLKTYAFSPWSLDLFMYVSFQLHGEHTILQPFRRTGLIVHIAFCATRYSSSPESSEAFEGEVPCPRTRHRNNVPRLRGEKHEISLKILHPAGFETAPATSRQTATSAKRHDLTISPCPTL